MTPALEITNLSVQLRGRNLLEGISLSVAEGEVVGLIGPNGGGKTMLLKAVLGLVPKSCGTIRIFGTEHTKALHDVGYVPQFAGFQSDYPMSVLDMVLMGRIDSLRKGGLHFCFCKEDRDAANAALEKVRLVDKRREPIGALSGGQVQRALIARAIVSNPRLLLLDEPTASLDPALGVSFFELLHEIAEGLTLILVSHDIGVIAEHVTSIACLNKQLHYHPAKELSQELIEKTYGCPLELLAHGHHAHRVLKSHD